MEQTKTVFEIRAIMPKEALGENQKTIANRTMRDSELDIKSNNEIVNRDLSSGFKKTVSTAAVIYATSQMVVQPMVRENVNRATITGDYVQAASIQRTQQIINKSVGLGLEVAGIVGAFMINPVVGGVALLGTATKYVQEGIAREQQNRLINAENNINTYINSYESARFIDIKAGR